MKKRLLFIADILLPAIISVLLLANVWVDHKEGQRLAECVNAGGLFVDPTKPLVSPCAVLESTSGPASVSVRPVLLETDQ